LQRGAKGKRFLGKCLKTTIKKNINHLGKAEIFGLCEALWKSGYLEESFVACNWPYYLHKNYEPSDFEVFENWLSPYVGN
jgi:hypothetical protein